MDSTVQINKNTSNIEVIFDKTTNLIEMVEDFYSVVSKVRKFKQLYKIHNVVLYFYNDICFSTSFVSTLAFMTKTNVSVGNKQVIVVDGFGK